MACRAAWQIQPSGFSPERAHVIKSWALLCFTWAWQSSGRLSRPLSYCGDGRQHCSGRKCGKTDRSDSGIIGKCIRPTYGLPTSNVSTNVVSRATRRLNGIGACRRPLCHFRKRRLNPLTKDLIMYDPHVGLDDTWLPLVGRTCLVLCTSPTRLAALCRCTWF